jgi:hypothetical protein
MPPPRPSYACLLVKVDELEEKLEACRAQNWKHVVVVMKAAKEEKKALLKEKEAVIKERDELITDRNKAIKTSVVLLWMIEARDDDDDAKLCYNCGVPCLSNDADNKQTVPSSTTAQTYVIAYDNIKECYTCSCPYYMYRRASKDELCKHITKLKSTGRLPIQPVK